MVRDATGRAVVDFEREATAFNESAKSIMLGVLNTVLTERTDVLVWHRLRVEFWVCGTFELRDGKILVWRDYFDNVDFFKGFVRGVFRIFR